ncbi:MAG: SGNH/GDSL hydrolase family protein [Marmoricola sp.]
MTRRTSRALTALVVAAVALGAAACGKGGFGGTEPTPTSTAIKHYVALGDGFVAAPYTSATADETCLRSRDNYPAQVAKSLGTETVTDVSCTGASTESLTKPTKGASGKKKVPAQFGAVTADTDLITLGIGLEEDNLVEDMFHICASLPCGRDVPATPLVEHLKNFGDQITAAIRTVQNVAPKAYIVVVGYPQIMPPTGLCSELPKMTDDQLTYANVVLKSVNDQLQSAARQTGSGFVDVAALSTDHTVCATDPWVFGAKVAPGKGKPFLPRTAEQAAVAKAVVAQVRAR